MENGVFSITTTDNIRFSNFYFYFLHQVFKLDEVIQGTCPSQLRRREEKEKKGNGQEEDIRATT